MKAAPNPHRLALLALVVTWATLLLAMVMPMVAVALAKVLILAALVALAHPLLAVAKGWPEDKPRRPQLLPQPGH